MILGVPQDDRIPFTTPTAARPGAFNPQAIDTGYKSHLNPFWRVMPPMMARGFRAPLPRAAMPGMSRRGGQYMAQIEAVQPAPPAPAPAPAPTAGWGYFGADAQAAAPAAPTAAPAPPAAAMTPGRRGRGPRMIPYALMREGLFSAMGYGANAMARLPVVQSQQVQALVPYGAGR